MAIAMCFCLVLRRSLVNWKSIGLPLPLKFWHCKTLISEHVLKGRICSIPPDFGSEKRQQDDRGGIPYICLGLAGIFYAVVFGVSPAECIGEGSLTLSGEDQENKENTAIHTPLANVKTRDLSGRFSSASRLFKTKERKCHAVDLLKGINSVKQKLDYEDRQEEEDKEHWK